MAYTQSQKSINLRQKAINLFYLIFLILFFTYISSDFLDSVNKSNESFQSLCEESKSLTTSNTLFFINLLRSDPQLMQKTLNQFQNAEILIDETAVYLEGIKYELLKNETFDQNGLAINGHTDIEVSKLMLAEKKAQELYTKLDVFKKLVAEFLSVEEQGKLLQILPLPKYEKNREGKLQSFESFYFNKTSLNVGLLTLTQLRARIEKVRSLVYESIAIRTFNELSSSPEFANFLNLKDVQLYDILEANSIVEFFKSEQIDEDLGKTHIEPSKMTLNSIIIESQSDTIHQLGTAIKFIVKFDTALQRTLKIRVSSKKGTEIFGISRPGDFVYFPVSNGYYTFLFDDGNTVKRKKIKVIDVDPFIKNARLSTIYVGIDNPLLIRTSEFDASDDLFATITNGEVFRKGELFYARVTKSGIVKLSIFANMPYGKVKVAEKSFIARNLNPPKLKINGHYSGGNINSSELRKTIGLTAEKDEMLLDEQVSISKFEFMVLFADGNRAIKPVKNIGASFNPEILKVIQSLKSGDIIFLSNIKTKYSSGLVDSISGFRLNIN